MAKTIARRVPLRKILGSYTDLDPNNWKELEKILGVQLPASTRERIDEANRNFAKYGPRQSKQNTIALSKVKAAIQKWADATDRLRNALRAGPPSSYESIEAREHIIAAWRKKRKRLKKALPLEFLEFSTGLAHASAKLVLSELENSPGPIRTDMWCAWVCIIAAALKDHGVKFSAASRDKGEGSKFVKAVEHLQTSLPPECQLYVGYDSIAKYVQQAKRSFGDSTERSLHMIIGFWGSGIAPPYPGNLSQRAEGRISVVYRFGSNDPLREL